MFDAEKVTELDKAVRKLELLLAHRIDTGGRIEFPDHAVRVVLTALSSLRDAAPEWEYQCNLGPYSDGQHTSWIGVAADHRCGGRLRRRRAAGPWLPVPEGNQ